MLEEILQWLGMQQQRPPLEDDPRYQRWINAKKVLYPEVFYSDSNVYGPKEMMSLTNPTFMTQAQKTDKSGMQDAGYGPLSGQDLDSIMQNVMRGRYNDVHRKKYGML